MEIKWNITHRPTMGTVVYSYMSGKVGALIDSINQTGVANITVEAHTKTSLNIEVWHEEVRFCVAHIPAGAERFKFVETSSYCYFDSRTHTRHYFRISKKQNMEALKHYLALVLGELGLKCDTLTVNLDIIGVDALQEAA